MVKAKKPVHPGEILNEELETLGLSAAKLARLIDVPTNRISQLVAGKRNMTADTALRLAQYLGSSAEFWMNLQKEYELEVAQNKMKKVLSFLPKRPRQKIST